MWEERFSISSSVRKQKGFFKVILHTWHDNASGSPFMVQVSCTCGGAAVDLLSLFWTLWLNECDHVEAEQSVAVFLSSQVGESKRVQGSWVRDSATLDVGLKPVLQIASVNRCHLSWSSSADVKRCCGLYTGHFTPPCWTWQTSWLTEWR